eukprot:CAMPEP_0171205092 /NCGR_PEP_ID=MMETSP0790-20130122/26374_1 /TAXON_ID=2925 /ORGANISM="Alexandrium catenella, Strain OF101" /LENGTH=77 /DNA_ID=CAMNT_0011670605 /DNA_START=36 /DNA_END=267 /DNA_ORIENTATION=-
MAGPQPLAILPHQLGAVERPGLLAAARSRTLQFNDLLGRLDRAAQCAGLVLVSGGWSTGGMPPSFCGELQARSLCLQ